MRSELVQHGPGFGGYHRSMSPMKDPRARAKVRSKVRDKGMQSKKKEHSCLQNRFHLFLKVIGSKEVFGS